MATAHTCLSVSGSRGTGKSTLVHLLQRDRGVRRFLVLDPLGDWRVSVNDGDGGHVERVAHSLPEVQEYLNDRRIIGTVEYAGSEPIYDPSFDDEFNPANAEFSLAYVPEDWSEEGSAIYLQGYAKHLRNCTLIIEEAHGACRHPISEQLMSFAKRGRHYNAGLWCVSQRPSDISPDLRGELNASESWYLRLSEKVDLDVLRYRRGPEFSEFVADMPNFSAVQIIPGEKGWNLYHVTPNRLHFVRHEGESNPIPPVEE